MQNKTEDEAAALGSLSARTLRNEKNPQNKPNREDLKF